MLPVFADPKTDFVFKRIFGAEERKPLLIALLNHLLELEGERRILDVQHLSGEQHVAIPELKLSIVDVKCTDATGRRFVVEMQVAKVEKPCACASSVAWTRRSLTGGLSVPSLPDPLKRWSPRLDSLCASWAT